MTGCQRRFQTIYSNARLDRFDETLKKFSPATIPCNAVHRIGAIFCSGLGPKAEVSDILVPRGPEMSHTSSELARSCSPFKTSTDRARLSLIAELLPTDGGTHRSEPICSKCGTCQRLTGTSLSLPRRFRNAIELNRNRSAGANFGFGASSPQALANITSPALADSRFPLLLPPRPGPHPRRRPPFETSRARSARWPWLRIPQEREFPTRGRQGW